MGEMIYPEFEDEFASTNSMWHSTQRHFENLDELGEYPEEHSGDREEFNSKSKVMRNLAQRGQEADALETEAEMKQNRIEDLERQMGARDQVEEKIDFLANRIGEEQSTPDPPFLVEWVQWLRRRGDDSDQERPNSDES